LRRRWWASIESWKEGRLRQWDMRTKNEKVECVVDRCSDMAVSALIRA